MCKKTIYSVMALILLTVMCLTASASVTDPNIITGVIRYNPDGNSGDTEPAIVKGGLFDGAVPFVDREYLFGDANDLAGLDYIQTCVDDKDNPNHQLDVTVDKAGTLYLIIDNRVGDDNTNDPPTLGGGIMDWVIAAGFTQTMYSVDISTPGTVYSLPLAGAGTTSLYEQDNGGSRVMYLVAAAPTGWNLSPVITGVPATTQVLPGSSLVVDATVTDDGIPGTGISVQWTTESAPEGAVVDYSPGTDTEDVTISFSDLGEYLLKIRASDGEKTKGHIMQVLVQIPTFSLEGISHVDACNDSKTGPTSRNITVRSDIRNYNDGSAQRRRVGFYEYDISALKESGKAFANSYLGMHAYRRRNAPINVYGIKEEYDNFDLSSASWSDIPGLQNTPVPPLNSEITIETLDTADLSPLLLSVTLDTMDWEYSASAAALDEFLNADTDNTIVLMFIDYSPEGNSGYEIHSRTCSTDEAEPETGLRGILIKGNILPPTWAMNPDPAINTNQSTGLAELNWINPTGVGDITCDVYIGTSEPNYLDPDYGLDTLATGISGNSVSLSGYTLAVDTVYYWVVDVHDSGAGKTQGYTWSFNTENAIPTVDLEMPFQYLWLNNAGDPSSATAVINATVTDDGRPDPPGEVTLLWEQISGPVPITIDPNNIEDITVILPQTGTYSFQLSADDGGLAGSATTEIFVGATACEAAQAMPDYEPIDGDFNSDCYVNLEDFGTFALHWLECNSLAPCTE